MSSQMQIIKSLQNCRAPYFILAGIQRTHATNSEIVKSGLFILSFHQMQAYVRKIKAWFVYFSQKLKKHDYKALREAHFTFDTS